MSRTEFLCALEKLLQDIPAEERMEALKYYQDYFEEAGEEKEAEVLRELGSPEKVAAEIKAGLGGSGQEAGEFRETGYKDPRFEDRYPPERKEKAMNRKAEDTGRTGKIVLLVILVLAASPILLPVAAAVLCTAAGIALAVIGLFFCAVIAAAAVAVAGAAVFCSGILVFVPAPAVGLVLIGAGLLAGAAGAVLTVAAVRLCMIVLPGLIRFAVELCRKPFHRRKAVV